MAIVSKETNYGKEGDNVQSFGVSIVIRCVVNVRLGVVRHSLLEEVRLALE
jgi:hypothetical protein